MSSSITRVTRRNVRSFVPQAVAVDDRVAEKSFRAQRLYDVDAGGACRRQHRGDDCSAEKHERGDDDGQSAGHLQVAEIVARRRARRRAQRRSRQNSIVAITAPSVTTPLRRFCGCEPSARRMPNSRVRALTENASTPATPTTAIGSATAANTPKTSEFKRSGASTLARMSSRVAACSTG